MKTPLLNDENEKSSSGLSPKFIGGIIALGVLFVVTGGIISVTTSKKTETSAITAAMRNGSSLLIARGLNEEQDTLWQRLAEVCDTFGPRFSGSKNLEDALTWIHARAKADGLSVKEQSVTVPVWRRGSEWGKMFIEGPGGISREKSLTLVGLGMTNNTNNVAVRGKVTLVSSLADLDRRRADVPGTIVVFNNEWRGYGRTVGARFDGPIRAQRYGAIGFLLKSVTPYSLQSPHTGATDENTHIPAAAISNEDAAQIERILSRDGYALELEIQVDSSFEGTAISRNLIIDIKGEEFPDQYVIIGGHIDSWDNGDGAMDDGGGALASWHAVKMIHDLKLKPRRTIRAILFTNEENGNNGGEEYARNFSRTLPFVSLALESDAGCFQPYRIGFSGSDAAFKILQDLGTLLDPIKAGSVSKGGGGVDIDPMCKQGVPCSGLEVLDFRVGNKNNNPCKDFSSVSTAPNGDNSESYFWYHHTNADTVDKVDPEQLQASATAMAVWAYNVAMLDGLLPR